MPNSNVSDKTVYDYESFAKVEVTDDYSLILETLNHDLLPIGKGLGFPKGRHLVRLTVTAEVMKSELTPAFEPPTEDDLRQEHLAEQASKAFEESNGRFVGIRRSGITELF